MSRLMVVDGSNLFSRAWHTLGAPAGATPAQEAQAMATKVGGMLQGLVRRHAPSHLVVALDSPNSFRREAIPGYKADRKERVGPATAELTDMVRPALQAWGVATREADGFEADDVVATLVAQATVAQVAVDVVSKDTDLLALVSDQADARVLWPEGGAAGEVAMNEHAVFERVGCYPFQLLDFRTMVGGKDNLPRIGWTPDELEVMKAERGGKKVPAPWGFTEKRAIELLGEHTLLGMFKGAPGLKDAEREWLSLRQEEAMARRAALRLRDNLQDRILSSGRIVDVRRLAWQVAA